MVLAAAIKQLFAVTDVHEAEAHTALLSPSNTANFTKTNDDNEATGKPILVLHVGPPKTGSTTLQCTLAGLRDELKKDGYHYIGRSDYSGCSATTDYKAKKEFRHFAHALVTSYDCHDKLKNFVHLNDTAIQCWEPFMQQLNAYRDSKTNVIFSDEAMSNRIARTWQYRKDIPYPWEALKLVLQGWDVRILIVHRPLYDYLPSVYTEQHKPSPGKMRLKKWYGGGKCIDQGGKLVPEMFESSGGQFTVATLLKGDQTLYPTPAHIFELCRQQNFDILLVDMMKHSSSSGDTGSFIEEIICKKIPGLEFTCSALHEQMAEKEGRHNPSVPLHYDFVAVKACQSGLIDGALVSREEARKAIQNQQEDVRGLGPNDFPLICPGEDMLKKILDTSILHEERLRGNEWNQVRKELHKTEYRKMVEKKRLCSVDAASVLQDESWRRFFLELKR
eukprot:CAMPEP_0196819328 /NCGR_PEP_ID=MMETSP1362-20130617/70071_1 /TAXON_ID=163516 /ORGANISM="Leptocylindrus danicus, Strain CCMP1856" /LENGTH=446 /DNA_ID=CAMNT_0042197779 /DNA_START=225 /DNA_END=1565 /DNA_ORIENTATION=-